MTKQKLVIPVLAVVMVGGAVASYVGFASAQTTATGTTGTSVTGVHQNMTRPAMGPHVDGSVTAINGTTITLSHASRGTNDAATVYTVDASAAKINKNGAASTLSAISVGDQLFVEGTVSGTNVVATQVNDGMLKGGFGHGGPGVPGRKGGGVMGTVSAVNGSAITITGSDGKTYTVDAGSAKVQKVSSVSVSDVALGDTIGVQGTVSGNSVTATNIIDGMPFGGKK
jgi:Domain of unknown function (DUF5666)